MTTTTKEAYEVKGFTFLKGMKTYRKDGTLKVLSDEDYEIMRLERMKDWITFYRNNISFFVEHYMGVRLYAYQRFWINLMTRSTEFVGVCSRASAKSWLIGVYAIARCILYPNTTVALASSTKAQAGLIISEKCKELVNLYPNIAGECSSITTNQNKWEMTFHNGSKINVVMSGEGGRGHRSNITVLEERRLIPTVVIDSVIRPFLVSRQAPYMKKAEYAEIEELREEPQEIIITSAYYKSHEWWKEVKKFIRQISNDDPDVKGIFVDYLISIRHGIKTKKQMKAEQDKFDPISFLMEYGNIPYGSSSLSFFDDNFFHRTVKRGWRPITDEMYITTKKNAYDIPKQAGEIRLVAVDIAMRAGKKNDNTIITCARLSPSVKGWITEITYIESHNGKNTSLQALRIKQIVEEFDADTLIMDIKNAGISVYDNLTSVTKDENRGLEYPAYTVLPSENITNELYKDLTNRTLADEAKEIVFPIVGTAQLNSEIAIRFRERLKKKLVRFLIDDNAEEEYLIKRKNKDILDQYNTDKRAYLLQAHLQTNLLINESIALEMIPTNANGLIKLAEPEGARKDRYSSCSYLNYYVSLLDLELLRDKSSNLDDEQAFLGTSFIL